MSGDSVNAPIASGETAEVDQTKNLVSYETYSKAIEEVKKLRSQTRDYEANQKKLKEDQLQKDAQWQQLAETRAEEAKQLREELLQEKKVLNDAIKIGAFKQKLGGELKNPRLMSFVELDKIALNPDTREIDQTSLENVVKNFTKEFSDMINFSTARLPEVASRPANNDPKPFEKMDAKEKEQQMKNALGVLFK